MAREAGRRSPEAVRRARGSRGWQVAALVLASAFMAYAVAYPLRERPSPTAAYASWTLRPTLAER